MTVPAAPWPMAPPPEPLADRLAVLCASPHLLVCSDYDGTLAPIADSPGAACLRPEAARLLPALAQAGATRVAIISGRPLRDLQRHSRLEAPIVLVGSHGAESSLEPTAPLTDGQRALLDRLYDESARLCAAVPGSWIEVKPFGLAVHVRQADPAVGERLLATVRSGPGATHGVAVTPGKAVVDLSLSARTKGQAVDQLRTAWGTDPAVLYLGDDHTDESVFEGLRASDVGVKVGAGVTRASHRVTSDTEIPALLAAVLALRVQATAARDG